MARTPGLIRKAVQAVKSDLSRTDTNYRKFLRDQRRKQRVPGQLETMAKAPGVFAKGVVDDARAYGQKLRKLVGKKPSPKKPAVKKDTLYQKLAQRHQGEPIQKTGARMKPNIIKVTEPPAKKPTPSKKPVA